MPSTRIRSAPMQTIHLPRLNGSENEAREASSFRGDCSGLLPHSITSIESFVQYEGYKAKKKKKKKKWHGAKQPKKEN